MLEKYLEHVRKRLSIGLEPKVLDASQVNELVKLISSDSCSDKDFLLNLLINRVPPGVDEASYIKANFLGKIISGDISSSLISIEKAIEILGTMQGGYNIPHLIKALDDSRIASIASNVLSHTILIFDYFSHIEEKYKLGNIYAYKILKSWANEEWYSSYSKLSEKITVTVFKVNGETNTDDLSPAQDAWSRPDIPLHALSMLKNIRDGINPDQPGVIGPISKIKSLQSKGFPLAYAGDIVGTGSSRKSAVNSLLWFIGKEIPYVPNKKRGGIVLGRKIAPIFFNTLEDSGSLPIETDVSLLNMGDVIDIYPYEGKIHNHKTNKLLATFKLRNHTLLDSVRVGGRIFLIIGRSLSKKARKVLKLPDLTSIQIIENNIEKPRSGFSLAQKIVGRACGVFGVSPGTYCEPKVTTIGSQDTTGPLTRDELKDLACLKFSADLVVQSFCHTAAYPNSIDVLNYSTLSDFFISRGGIALYPGDGIIHSWLNRMLLPDTVGTGGDSHTRFPIGISFPAGSSLVAFAATTGIMPLNMPESVLVKFKGRARFGITIRDIVHSIPFRAIQLGELTIDKKTKKNVFASRILEIEGLANLRIEQAFELTNSSAERSAVGCTIALSKESVTEYLKSNLILLNWMITKGYKNSCTLEKRINEIKQWLKRPSLLSSDYNAKYASIIDIDLDQISEPILCAPNDPDNICLLSNVQGEKVDEVFIGSCMSNISHFRAAAVILKNSKRLISRLWLAPPTKMDSLQLIREGWYSIFGKLGARIETSGCSLCMGNQARVTDGATVVSTSTRNFPNRLGENAKVYLASAELAAVTALLGRLPSPNEYYQFINQLYEQYEKVYSYLNFDQIDYYKEVI